MQNYNSKFKIFKQNGQSIIEVIFAVGIVALVLVALVTAVTVSIRNATFSKNKSLATKFVNEGMEAVRSIRDNSWDNLVAVSGQTKGLDGSTGTWVFNGSSDPPATGFTREATVSCDTSDPDTATSCDITVEVSWISGTQTHMSKASTTYTKWTN